MHDKIRSLRVERQFLHRPATREEYPALYRDMAPGQSVYWHGFGDPPSLTFRADFDDMEYNRQRQAARELVKGRFQGGNLGWVEKEDFALFAGLAMKPLEEPNPTQRTLMELIEREGPMNIQLMKEFTGLLVKQITPALHRLQEAFWIYEDQYDGEWDRGWHRMAEIFPEVDVHQYTRHDALMVLIPRFARRNVWIDEAMLKSFYKVPVKDIKKAAEALCLGGVLTAHEKGYLLADDLELLQGGYRAQDHPRVLAMHRNDFWVKSSEHWLKPAFPHPEREVLHYIWMDGQLCGAVFGKFKYGPYIIEDVVVDLPADVFAVRKNDIIEAIYAVNPREESPIHRFMGEEL